MHQFQRSRQVHVVCALRLRSQNDVQGTVQQEVAVNKAPRQYKGLLNSMLAHIQ
jgi:hypothetical protein